MLKKERHNFILSYLELNGTVMASALCVSLSASHDTIRRDLRELSEDGKLMKVHGGAVLIRSETQQLPSTVASIIAAKTAPLLCSDSFILTCGGEAVMEMYRFIPSYFNATLLTASIHTAARYCEHPTMEVVQLGDRIVKTSKIAAGGEATAKIRQIRADMCILDSTGIDPLRGLTESNWQIAQVKKAMAESSAITICLAASSTIGKIAAMQVCAPQNLAYLITELDPRDTILDAYRARGIIVL
ncbi:DeoR/GlpR transcriptional regulator [Pedobacter polaris]|uniref:DeoR/GlpR transcriptional regulator n=1 Tax=Pedobacter polaris TaxID=2571273 RepID=A0A4U1CI65_9SPHI|nr:DeoR/GlpR family DNA-binding transcription regulator [Pedobacter polaris]TKC06547.1 DeoR/GlpR transcriptional regulator [Pedobacter polaris]